MKELTCVVAVEDMIEDLEQYFEAAGFTDFREKVLAKMSEDQIRAYYLDTFENEEL